VREHEREREEHEAPGDEADVSPGPEAHWAKLAFEKYFLATHKRGHV
jgi:hypothetical protein